jgi:hypothetical protein
LPAATIPGRRRGAGDAAEAAVSKEVAATQAPTTVLRAGSRLGPNAVGISRRAER